MRDEDKMFRILPQRVEDESKAKVLEALLNRPEIVARIMAEVEKHAKEAMDEILWGSKP